jgi:nucleotide-binding universal stress UspA family protein
MAHAKALAVEGGGVTQRLLHLAPCPVLAVPPDRDTSE